MTVEECEQLMQEHGVKPTANRIMVLQALGNEPMPITLLELESTMQTVDKSVLFRTLTLFQEHHMLHVIEDGAGRMRYELCRSHDHNHDDDLHVHFYCNACRRTFCFNALPLPGVALPAGFEMSSANYVVKGVCAQCRHRHKGELS